MKQEFLKKLSVFIMLFATFMSYAQGGTVSIANLKYTNGSVIPAGSAIEIYEGGTQSITFDLVFNNPNYILKYGSIYVYSEKTHLASLKTQYVNVDYNNSVTFPPYYSQQYTIILDARSFNATGGNLFPQVTQVGYAPFEGTRIPVKVKAVPQISNNVISSSAQTILEGEYVLLTGTPPLGGLGNYTYTWQKQELGNSDWITIPGMMQSSYAPAGLSKTTKFRRVVKSSIRTHNSNAIEITVNPYITNNTIKFNGTDIIGSIPLGGSGNYTYEWYMFGAIIEPTIIEGATNKDYTPSSWMIQNDDVQQLFFARSVKVDGRSSGSNYENLKPPIQNNFISISGNQITGSMPTGGNSVYTYEWYGFISNEGEIIEVFQLNETGQNHTIQNVAGIDITYYRVVKSGERTSGSNQVTKAAGRMAPQALKSQVNIINAYPNPTTQTVNFETNFEKDTDAEVIIYNESGKSTLLFKGNLKEGQIIEWNIPSDYSKGLYFYKISSGNQELKIGKILYQ